MVTLEKNLAYIGNFSPLNIDKNKKKVWANRPTPSFKKLKISIILFLDIFQTQAFGFEDYEFGKK